MLISEVREAKARAWDAKYGAGERAYNRMMREVREYEAMVKDWLRNNPEVGALWRNGKPAYYIVVDGVSVAWEEFRDVPAEFKW